MSWSLSVPVSTAAEFEANARAALESQAAHLDSEGLDQAEQVIAAAGALLATGVIGGEDKHFTVSLSGHSNPGHAPKEGWSNDSVSISVYQAAAPVPAAEATG